MSAMLTVVKGPGGAFALYSDDETIEVFEGPVGTFVEMDHHFAKIDPRFNTGCDDEWKEIFRGAYQNWMTFKSKNRQSIIAPVRENPAGPPSDESEEPFEPEKVTPQEAMIWIDGMSVGQLKHLMGLIGSKVNKLSRDN